MIKLGRKSNKILHCRAGVERAVGVGEVTREGLSKHRVGPLQISLVFLRLVLS